QRLCSSHIDRQLVPRWQLHRQFTRIGATQHAVNIRRTPASLFQLINSVRDQAPTSREVTERIDGWQIKLASQRNDKLASESSDRTGCPDPPAICLPRERLEGWLDFTGVAGACRCYCNPRQAGSGFNYMQEPNMLSRLRMMEECYPPHFRRDLFEYFQPFTAQLRFEIVESCNFSARMR